MAGAELVLQRQAVIDLPFGVEGADVLARPGEVPIGRPVIDVAPDAALGDRLARDLVGRDPEVRQAPEEGVRVVGGQPQGARGVVDHIAGDAPAVVGGEVAAGDVRILDHAVHAHVEDGAHRPVDIEGSPPPLVIEAAFAFERDEIPLLGLLGHDVERAAGGAPAGEGRGRAAQDLHLLVVEVLPDAHARIAHAVHEHVVARVEAADEEAVAERVAAFA